MTTLVGKTAPNFSATAVVDGNITPQFTLSQFHGKKYVVLFFYPKDFTFVCPTELHAFQAALSDFKNRDVQVIGCSTDTEFSHWGWLQVPKDKGGIAGVTYPLVADTNKTISEDYGVLAGEYVQDSDGQPSVQGELVAFRGLFLIDKNGVVQHQLVNNMPLGRSVDEVLRLVDALQHVEQHGEVCPANWNKGKKAMSANAESTSNYLANH